MGVKLIIGVPPRDTEETCEVSLQDDGAGGIDIKINDIVVMTVSQDSDGVYMEAIECGGCDDAIQMDEEQPEYIWVNF